MGLLNGKKALILGVANEKSIAWAMAKLFQAEGAELMLTYAGEAIEKRVRPLAESIGAIVAPCNVTSDEEIAALMELAQQRWGGIDILIHSVAFADKEELKGTILSTTSAGFATALDISAYSLIVEDGTRLAARVARGELPGIDDDVHADRYQRAEAILTDHGYDNYEVSNWSLPGHACRHNLAYWRGDDWWGIGPGAHSHIGGVRWWNRRHPRDYTAALATGSSPAQGREVLSAEQRRIERVLLELRLSQGLELAVLTDIERSRVAGFVADGLATADADVLRLTPAGRLLADAVIRDLVEF